MAVVAPPNFTCAVQPDRERVVLALSGELDLAAVPEPRRALDELLRAGFERVVVDLRDLTFMDSAGLHMLISATAWAAEHGCKLSLIRGPLGVQRVFELTGCEAAFTFESARFRA